MPTGAKYAPNFFAVAPLGSKSDSCGIETPSCSRKAFCESVASVETPYSFASPKSPRAFS
jgi:hypothetical protein